MKSMMRRTTRREITASFGRYMAIMAIIALGVGLFAGLKVTKPTMVMITDEYVTAHQLYDYRLICTLGLEKEDIDAFEALEGVRAAEGAVFADVLYHFGDDEADYVASMHSLTQRVNTLALRAGRMPRAANECVADEHAFTQEDIGKTIVVSDDNSEDTRKLFAYEEYVIVGLVSSPAYLNFERGNTSVGNGVVRCFLYAPEEGFSFDYYSEAYVKLDSDFEIHSDAYQEEIDARRDSVEEAVAAAADRRYDMIVSDARQTIDDAQKELDEQSAEAEAELRDAREELEKGEEELRDARAQLDGQKEELTDAVRQLEEGISQLDDGEAQLTEAVAAAGDGLAQVREKLAQVRDALAQYRQLAAMQQNQQPFPETAQQYSQQSPEAAQQYSQQSPEVAQQYSQQSPEAAQQYSQQSPEAAQQYQQLSAAEAELAAQEEQLVQTLETLNAQLVQLREQRAALEGQLAQANDGLLQIEEGYAGLDDAQRTIDEGWAEYEDGLAEYEEQAAEGQREIDDAQRELDGLEEGSCYLLTRNENVGYVCFDNDASIVEGIADVFPVFFFLVAALVCITTMNRMVEEQRTQIGVLKALGYGKAAIMSKYMIYSGSAAMIGCIAGFLIGSYVFPNVIWSVYQLMYSVGGSGYIIDVPLACISVVVALLCSIGTTWLSCRIELGSVAAQLIRPKSPKSGKRIFLERIGFLWKRMKFLHKVSARNILRYKKRFFMMVIGIGGCTALVLTGLGIKDSIADVVTEQYDRIQTYDMSVSLKDVPTQAQREEFEETADGRLETVIYYMASSVDISCRNTTRSVNLIVPEKEEEITQVLRLFDQKGETIDYPGEGEAVLTVKCAERLGVRAGDTVTLRDGDMRELQVKITGIATNYVDDYLYITAQTYRSGFGEEPAYKSIWCNIYEGQDVHAVNAAVMKLDNAASVTVTVDMKERFTAMMSSLNSIVVLVIFCAAALAFIVLYNLTNINITERIREIATIKVLGFYPGETASYVFRENMVLTAIGAVAGIPFGVLLHRFVMEKVDIDMVNFHVQILPRSYLFGIALTFVFAMLVNGLMYFKLQKINMAESLKSIE